MLTTLLLLSINQLFVGTEGSILPPPPLQVSVKVSVVNGDTTYMGSGTLIDSRNGKSAVLTCWHTHRDVPLSARTLVEHAGRTYLATVAKTDPKNDLSLLLIDTNTTLPTAPLASVLPFLGERLINCGRNSEGKLTVEETSLTAIDRYNDPPNLECNSYPNQGRSGGGLFNAKHELVGVLQGRLQQRLAIYVRLPPILTLLERTEEKQADLKLIPRKRRVLSFTATWCGPCNTQQSFKNEAMPWLAKSSWIIDETERAHVQIVDIDKHPELAQKYSVQQIPALLLIEDDREIRRETYKGPNTVVNMMFDKPDTSPVSPTSPAVSVSPTQLFYTQPTKRGWFR